MSSNKCQAKNPATCVDPNCPERKAHAAKLDNAIKNHDLNAYMDARDNTTKPDFTKMFTDAVNEERISVAIVNEALEEIRFYDKYMIDAGLYTDNDDLADEKESNLIEIEQNLDVLISEYNTMSPELKKEVRDKLTTRDKEVIKNFYDEIAVPVPKDFQ